MMRKILQKIKWNKNFQKVFNFQFFQKRRHFWSFIENLIQIFPILDQKYLQARDLWNTTDFSTQIAFLHPYKFIVSLKFHMKKFHGWKSKCHHDDDCMMIDVVGHVPRAKIPRWCNPSNKSLTISKTTSKIMAGGRRIFWRVAESIHIVVIAVTEVVQSFSSQKYDARCWRIPLAIWKQGHQVYQ